MPFAEPEQKRLLEVAKLSIRHGLRHRAAWEPDTQAEPTALREPCATFVTLHLRGQLRGCIGTLEAHRPLVEDVAANAYSAAFEDPRFSPVTAGEADQLDLHISILTPPEPMAVRSEEDLLEQLRPGRDGLILREGYHRATFLPAVWADLPDPRAFLSHLKRKAGLPADYWSPTLDVWRYRAESVEEATTETNRDSHGKP